MAGGQTVTNPGAETEPEFRTNRLLAFFEGYRSLTERIGDETWATLHNQYDRLLTGYINERKRATEIESAEASKYDIFRILRLQRSEVWLHTPMLANLLSPTGSHAQGDMFYRQFIKSCINPERQQRFLNVAPNQLSVMAEKRNPYGQIDIGIYSSSSDNRFALIIENKVDAPDQDKQLYRYYEYATKALGLSPESLCLVYLKPVDDGPDLRGLSQDQIEQIKTALVRIRYRPHIVDFLDGTMPMIRSSKVKATVAQYLQTIKNEL